MNNKGFTLIEVLAAFVLLGILATFATISVIDYLDAADTNAKELLKENIKAGMINYYNECKYMPTSVCESSYFSGNTLNITIEELVTKGFLSTQNEQTEALIVVKDPTNPNDDISDCGVSITYDSSNKVFGEVQYSNDCGSLSN